jgi:hypothetical protein
MVLSNKIAWYFRRVTCESVRRMDILYINKNPYLAKSPHRFYKLAGVPPDKFRL